MINILRDVEVADCRWQSFCDLTESADESHPLQPNGMYGNNCRGGVPNAPTTPTNIDKLYILNLPMTGDLKGEP